MDTNQNPFANLPESEVARFHIYLIHRNNFEAFAKAAQLSLAQAMRWAAQPFVDACLNFHIQRLVKILTIDSLNARQHVMTLALEASNASNSINSLPPPTTPAEQKTYTAKRQGVNALLRGLSILTRLVSANIATQVRQTLNVLTPPTTKTKNAPTPATNSQPPSNKPNALNPALDPKISPEIEPKPQISDPRFPASLRPNLQTASSPPILSTSS